MSEFFGYSEPADETLRDKLIHGRRACLTGQIAHHTNDQMFEALDARRRLWITHRDEMLVYQKECGSRGDRDGARFFKEAAADAMKCYRGACVVIGAMFPFSRGDCPFIHIGDVPPEILPYAITEYGAASLYDDVKP